MPCGGNPILCGFAFFANGSVSTNWQVSSFWLNHTLT